MEIVHLSERRYRRWRARLSEQDRQHVGRRLQLLERHGVELGMPNVRRLFSGVWEVRVPTGVRMYFTIFEGDIVFVDYGNKDTQSRNMSRALQRAQELHDADRP